MTTIFLIISISIGAIYVDLQSCVMLMVSSLLGIILNPFVWDYAADIIGQAVLPQFIILKPILAAILAHSSLNEPLDTKVVLGILICSSGISMVAYELSSAIHESLILNSKARSNHSDNVKPDGQVRDEDDDEENVESSSTHSNNQKDDDLEFEIHLTNIDTDPSNGNHSHTCDSDSDDHSFADSDDDKSYSSRWITKRIKIAENNTKKSTSSSIGYILAFISILLDAYSLVLLKQFGRSYSVWQINVVRFGSASAILMAILMSKAILPIVQKYSATTSKIISLRTHQADSMASHNTDSMNIVAFSKLSDNSSHPIDIVLNPISQESVRETYHNSHIYKSTPISLDSTVHSEQPNPSSLNQELIDFSDAEISQQVRKYVSSMKKEISTMTRQDYIEVSLNVLVSTFLGSSLMVYALLHLNIGFCITLLSYGPLALIPTVYYRRIDSFDIKIVMGIFLTLFGSIMLV